MRLSCRMELLASSPTAQALRRGFDFLNLKGRCSRLVAALICGVASAAASPPQLEVSLNHHYLVAAPSGQPVFLLADTAWNLGALKLDEADAYLQSRADHGFNAVMFALNFSPQAEARNAYGEPAYVGPAGAELNPAYFAYCQAIVDKAAQHGLYVVLFAMWAGEKAGTMNHYSPAELHALGQMLGHRFAGVSNVIFCAGGEASPNYVDVDRVNSLGRGLKEGCEGRNLVTVHPTGGSSASKFYRDADWLDFYLCQGKSGTNPRFADYDAAALVLNDWTEGAKPTMMGEQRYESGTQEDPWIQRSNLYQCVFAGGCGYAYGHNALWQMTPHTAQPWMLKGWNPGVANWREVLDTPAIRQLRHITALLYAHPYLSRIPDQSLVLEGQGTEVSARTQVTRDGTLGKNDATYLLAYITTPRRITLNTAVIAAPVLRWSWFNPATGETEVVDPQRRNSGSLTLEPRSLGRDWVVVVEAAAKP
jgi:Protein of unknown function (DUF4038)/Putative collagen-binding domain of a collagenase